MFFESGAGAGTIIGHKIQQTSQESQRKNPSVSERERIGIGRGRGREKRRGKGAQCLDLADTAERGRGAGEGRGEGRGDGRGDGKHYLFWGGEEFAHPPAKSTGSMYYV